MLEKTTALVFAVLGASLSVARADTDSTGAGAPPMAASDSGPEQLVLPKGRLVLDAYLEINLSDQLAGKPISISPDLWYGVNDDLTVGLVHSYEGTYGFIGGNFQGANGRAGSALCLTGAGNGCNGDNVYNNVGVEGRYKLKLSRPDVALAAVGGLYIDSFKDPFAFAIKVGALGRWHKDKLAVEVQPSIFIGVTNRTIDSPLGPLAGTVNYNRDLLNLPITVLYDVIPKLSVAGQVGVVLPFEDAGDTYQIPLSIGAHYTVNESLMATLALSLPVLAGGDGNIKKGIDARSVTLGGTYAF